MALDAWRVKVYRDDSTRSDARPVVMQPTPEAKKAIEDFVRYGTWPKPGTMPVCIRLGR